MSVISQKVIKEAKGGVPVNGVILVKGYSVKLTKNGKEYIEGQMQSGSVIPFKAWGQSSAFSMLKNNDFSNCPSMISGSFDEYNGTVSIVVDTIVAVDGYTPSQFLEVRYQKDAYANALKQIVQANTSEKGYSLASKILFDDAELFDRFAKEFAAKSHHDNCKSGLMVHTFKVLCLMSWVLQTYPNLLTDGENKNSQDRKDLYMIGSLLHDIGKTMEMNYGVYQPNSAISHRILGLDILYKYRADIESAYDEKWFRDLQSIIVEHHGEFADPCRTVVAYVVHKVDCFDSVMTGLAQSLDESMMTDTSGSSVRIDGDFLTV